MRPIHRDDTPPGSPLRISLWNLLYRIVSASDHSRTAWTSILRGACLVFFKEPIDDLPVNDNEASRVAFRDRFFRLPDHRVPDLLEFMLADDQAALKEVDRKLIRRSLNAVFEEEGAPFRLLRDRFVPLQDDLGLDAVVDAGEKLTLFDLAAASRHMESAMAFLARRPDPAGREAVRESVLAVAAVVHDLRRKGTGIPGGGDKEESGGEPRDEEATGIALGTIGPAAAVLGLESRLAAGIDAVLGRAHAVSGLPGGSAAGPDPSDEESTFYVVFCASVIRLLLDMKGRRRQPGPA